MYQAMKVRSLVFVCIISPGPSDFDLDLEAEKAGISLL
jgi:hypothetical protein